MKLTLKNVRISFPELYEAKAFSGTDDKKSFSASFLLPKNHPQVKEINAAIDAVAKEKWADKAAAVLKTMRTGDKLFIHDGDVKEYDGYAGNFYITARTQKRPVVRDADTTPLTAEDGKPYSGCRVYAYLELWAQDNQYGKRINATLLGVQFYKDDDAFAGGASISDEDFEDLSVDEAGGAALA